MGGYYTSHSADNSLHLNIILKSSNPKILPGRISHWPHSLLDASLLTAFPALSFYDRLPSPAQFPVLPF